MSAADDDPPDIDGEEPHEHELAEVVPIEDGKKPRARKPRFGWLDRLQRKGSKIEPILANIVTIVANDKHWSDLLSFDELQQSILTARAPNWDEDERPATPTAGPWTEADDSRLCCWLTRHYGVTVPASLARDAVAVVAQKRTVHPIREYLGELTWDGVPRVHEWTTRYLGVQASRYSAAVGACFLISAVARAMQPGCKVDTMPILEGPQGTYKSTAVRVLFGASFVSDTPINFEDKDRFVALRGRWCVEMAELDGLDKSDINRVKSYLSSAQDDYRPPYGRYICRFPRQCVFFGTVNGADYLRDPTGGRRFWPLRVGRIDIEALGNERDQLWAEARNMFEDGKPWWPASDLVADFEAQQSGRIRADEWLPIVEKWVGARDFVTVGDVLSFAFSLPPEKWSQPDQNRVAACLQQMGYFRAQRRLMGKGGPRVRGYQRPGAADDDGAEVS